MIERWFANFDTDRSGMLSRDEMAKLLEHAAGERPSDDALDTAMKKATSIDTNGDGQADTIGVSKKAATQAVTKFQAYVKQEKAINDIFDQFDTNKSGELEKGQLRDLLKRVSPDADVADEDEAYVMELCDKSNTGTILRSEVLAACATWKLLLEKGEAPSTQAKASMLCVLL